MSPLEVRFEDVSGKSSLIVTANLAEGWRQLGDNFGFYGFAHQKYQENDLITVRVWVIESPSQPHHAPDGFPLDLQSMGSSPSRALAFRLFNGRLSLGAAMSTVVNSRRNNGSPGFYKEAVVIANHAGVAYWLRFYAALNDQHPEMPEWTEQDFLRTDEGALPGPGQIGELVLFGVEERLARMSTELDVLKERVGTLVTDFQGRLESSLQAVPGNSAASAEDALEGRLAVLRKDFQGRLESSLEAFQEKGAGQADDSEKRAQELRDQWSKQFEKETEKAVEKLREEANNSARALEESKQQLASLAEAKLASFNQVAALAVASLEAEQRRLKNQHETSRRELEDLITRRLAKLPPASVEFGSHPRRRGVVAMLGVAAGLFLVVTVPPLGVYLSTPPPVQLHLRAEPPADFADQSPYWGAKHRDREEEIAQAYWRAAVASLQGKYPFGSELPADPPADFQIDKKYDLPGGAKALAETRAHYWEKLRTSWGQRQFWVESQAANESWAVRLRRAWEQIKAKFA